MSEGDRSAEGEGSVAGWQGRRKQRRKLVGWVEEWEFVGGLLFFYNWIPTFPPQLKLKLSPLKPNSPNVPDEKWPITHCFCSLRDTRQIHQRSVIRGSEIGSGVETCYLSDFQRKKSPHYSITYIHITCEVLHVNHVQYHYKLLVMVKAHKCTDSHDI